jgi:hypothetical protein
VHLLSVFITGNPDHHPLFVLTDLVFASERVSMFQPQQVLATMPRAKRQKLHVNKPTANPAADSPADTTPFASPIVDPWAPHGPSETCSATCCRKGQQWVDHHFALDIYKNGPSVERLDTAGCWAPLTTRVGSQAQAIQRLGLRPWRNLGRSVQTRLKSWSPAAKQLWQSDFIAHREAMVRAWIWHYLDDNLFSFAGAAQDGTLVPLSSSTWEHVRALRRDLDGESLIRLHTTQPY